MNPLRSLILRDLPFFNFNKVAIVVINVLALFLLFVVFKFNKYRDAKSRIFGLMSLFMITWVNFAFLARLFGFYENISIVFLRIAWTATPFLFYSTYLVSLYIIGEQERLGRSSLILLVLTFLLSLMTAFTDFTIKGITFTSGYLDIIYGKGFYPFLIVIFMLIVFTIYPILRTKLTESSKSFLLGVTIFYILNLIFNITLPVLFKITYLYWLGDYSTIFLLGFTTYSIVKFRLFDVRVVVTEAITIIILTILLSRIFVSGSLVDRIIDIFIFLVMTLFGILLIRSVLREIKQREELEKLNTKLQEMDAQKNEFISMAAHELRTPMSAIKGYVSMILEGVGGSLNEKAREYLIDIKNINERMIRLVNNMLNVSRIEEGRLVFQFEVENLSQILRIVFNQFRSEAERKGLKYELIIPSQVRDKVRVDIDKIQEVIGNLLSNAIKYTDSGSVKVKLSQPKENVVRCEVIDTGPGISEEEQKKIFQKFQRAKSIVGKTTGTGLGLYISKLLVEKMNGRIGLKSEVGKGSTFWFELPLVEDY